MRKGQGSIFKSPDAVDGKVGVFSMYAVQEARDLFWGSMGQGKAFAKRASMWYAAVYALPLAVCNAVLYYIHID